ncbi:phage tail sheath C-terminal domain-containing protein [uncultured Tateyamaria sp.]|uniref:phage tail sheath C-terminal domain-containing protein n=1 Tax=uncultured Tateyamaria sp. TaxID=455651 RepID=UPI0026142DA9|nr:phage tail sheath C-terminal domain-containing protein [uncultured Tateyamaria sp.]
MAEYRAPGVYIEEKDLKPPSIEAVSTSTTGMVGHAVRGPVSGTPVLVTNMLQFRQRFGGALPAAAGTAGELFYAAQGFFANGGRRLYVMRAAGNTAAATAFATQGGVIARLAPGADAAVGGPTARLTSTLGLREGTALTFTYIEDGITYTSSAMAIAAAGVDSATGDVTLTANLDITPAGPTAFRATASTVTSGLGGLDADGVPQVAARPASLTLTAAEPGSWGDEIEITTQRITAARGVAIGFVGAPAVDDTNVRLASSAGFYVNAWVQIDRGPDTDKILRQVTAVNGTIVTLAGPAVASVAPVAPATETVLTVQEFSLTASYDAVTEVYSGLTMADVPGKYVVDQINQRSALLRIDAASMPADTDPMVYPVGDDGISLPATTAGIDDAPNAAEIRGVDGGAGARTGLRALEVIDDISIICAPGWGDAGVQGAMIEQCERLRYRVALLDPEATGSAIPSLTGIQAQRLRFDSKYAAIYYPRIIIRDVEDQPRAIGPAGHMAGLCARVDNERGVFKSPANEVMRNVTDVEVMITKGEHEILNPMPNNINAILDKRADGMGIRIYGARCITSLSDWKYLAVRRLFVQIERSLEIGTQWAVLEPNDPRLWDRLIGSVDAFLTQQWRRGALLGTKKEEAFFIRCGTSTMTQLDIDNGQLRMQIGIAPVKPAEFIILEISQTQSAMFASEA